MRTLSAVLLFATTIAAFAQSQAEMTRQAGEDFAKADARLNAAYAKVKAALDAESLKKLKDAQRAWLAFRDAEASFQADAEARGGSMQPMVFRSVAQQLTETRIEQLKALLERRAAR